MGLQGAADGSGCLCGCVPLWVGVCVGMCLSGWVPVWVCASVGGCLCGCVAVWVGACVGGSCVGVSVSVYVCCLLYTSDAADER